MAIGKLNVHLTRTVRVLREANVCEFAGLILDVGI